MPHFKAKNLSPLLAALKSTTKFTTKPSSLTKSTTKPSSLTSPAATTTEDRPLKPFVSSVYSKAALLSTSVTNFSHDSPKLRSTETTVDFGVAREGLLSSVDDSVSRGTNNANALETVLGIPCFSTESTNNNISQLQKEVLHERRQKWILKNTPTYRFEKFANLCANKIGTDATLYLFGRLWRETSLEEYNLSIRICIEQAMDCDHEDAALEKICQAFQLFNFMKEQGFQLEEETYGPLLRYLIDMSMIEEFYFFRKAFESGNSHSDPRLDYYEMLLWIRVNKEENIQNFFKCTAIDHERDCFNLKAAIDYEGDYFKFLENNLLALCESKQNSEFLQYLEMVITKVSSLDHMMSIFKLLGRLVLESFAEKNLLALKISGYGAENVSNVIFSYTSGIPNLEVEDIISKFRDLHAQLEIKPSSASYEKLIAYTCDLDMDVGLDLVDEMSEAGLTLSIDTVNSILIACEEKLLLDPVPRIYLIICHHNLKPNSETFRCMISLSMEMEDFDGAYAMLCDEKKMNLMLTADMYNAIMDGYSHKKDMAGVLKVLKQMEKADVKPNSQTFSYLIKNCSNEKDIVKYYEEMTCSGVQVTKQVFMALITAYASCGEFEKAKQVILDKGIPFESLNEIKESLVEALASNGQIFDALVIYEEIKQVGRELKPEAASTLMAHVHSLDFSRAIKLLEDLNSSRYWMDGCFILIFRSLRLKSLSLTVLVLKLAKDNAADRFVLENFLWKVFFLIADTKPTDLQFGFDLLRIMKNELDLSPSAECFNLLLGGCVKEKNLQMSRLIWKEYESASLPHSSLTRLWMYQAFSASGDRQSARKILNKIPKETRKIRMVIMGLHENRIKLEEYNYMGPKSGILR